MATNTTNYQLVKPALTDSPPDITAMNPNWDKIDQELKKNADSAKDAQTFATAGGTATAITIPAFTLENGISRTFIASAANGGAATTLNTKPIYKPNTVITPNIVAGKAYEVWYSSVGDCFFLKASAEGNAVAANVLAGTTFSNDDDTGIPGGMVDNGPASAETINLTSNNQEYTIAQGYHSGLRKIKAVITNLAASVIKAGTTVGGILGTFTSDATATAGNILSGAIAYVNGNKITGTMANRGKVTQSLGVNGSYTIPEGYHDGTGVVSQSIPTKGAATITPGTAAQVISAGQYLSGDQTIAGDADLVSGNVRAGVNLFGVNGKTEVVDTYTTKGAVKSQILSGQEAWSNGAKRIGSMPNNGAQSATLTSQGASKVIPAGYTTGGTVSANISNLIAANILKGATVGGVAGTGSTIKHIQFFFTDDGLAVPTLNLSQTVVPANSIVLISPSRFFNDCGISNYTINTNSITLEKTATYWPSLNIVFIEFAPGVIKSKQTISFTSWSGGGASDYQSTGTFAAVDLSKTIVVLKYFYYNDSNDRFIAPSIDTMTSTTVNVSSWATGTQSFEIIEFY